MATRGPQRPVSGVVRSRQRQRIPTGTWYRRSASSSRFDTRRPHA